MNATYFTIQKSCVWRFSKKSGPATMLRKQKNKQQKQQHFSTVIKDFEEKPYLVYKNQSQSTSVLSPSLMMEKSSASLWGWISLADWPSRNPRLCWVGSFPSQPRGLLDEYLGQNSAILFTLCYKLFSKLHFWTQFWQTFINRKSLVIAQLFLCAAEILGLWLWLTFWLCFVTGS